MTAALTPGEGLHTVETPRAELVRELYESGMTQGQVALKLRISIDAVRKDMRSRGVRPRLMVVNSRHVTKGPPVMQVDPSSVAVAFSADRGWHLTKVPPAWTLEMLADLD